MHKISSAPAWPGILLILVLTALAYIPAYSAGFIWDDDFYVSENPLLTAPGSAGLRDIWLRPLASPQYYPLVFTTFWIEHRLWGMDPAGYHAVNVAVHAAASALLFLLLRRLRAPLPLVAAVLFAVHPVHVESVAWITERKNTLMALFYIASVLAALRWALPELFASVAVPSPDRDPAPRDSPATRRAWYASSLALFACAMLSKTVACSVPAALLLLLYWKRGRIAVRDVLLTAPFFALGFAGAVATSWLERHHVGAGALDLGLSPADRVVLAGRAAWFYAHKLVYPVNLTFFYPKWSIDAAAPLQWLAPAAAALAIAALWFLRKRLGRGPLVAILFFLGSLVPALGFIDVYPFRYSWVADHFQYISSIGLFSLAAAIIHRLASRPVSTSAPPAAAAPIPSIRPPSLGLWLFPVAALVLTLAAMTWNRSRVYRNLETLWKDTIARNPASWAAHNNLGGLYLKTGRVPEGIRLIEHALSLNPHHAQGLNNLALAYAGSNRLGLAKDLAARARAADPTLPQVFDTSAKVATALAEHAEAERFYAQAARLMPDAPALRFAAGAAATRAFLWEPAASHFRAGLEIDPTNLEARAALSLSLARIGRAADALREAENAITRDPRYAPAHLAHALALVRSDRPDEALPAAHRALDLRPNWGPVLAVIGMAHDSAGRADQAETSFREALRFDPAARDAVLGLARLLARTQRSAEAAAMLRSWLMRERTDREAQDLLAEIAP